MNYERMPKPDKILKPLVNESQEKKDTQELPPPPEFKVRSELGPDEAKQVEISPVNPDNLVDVAPTDRINNGEKVLIDDSEYTLERYDGITGDVILKDAQGTERIVSQKALYGQNIKNKEEVVKAPFAARAYGQLIEKGEQRLEVAKGRFAGFKNKIKESLAYQYSKKYGTAAVQAIAASPELAAYSRDFVVNSPQLAKEAISRKTTEALNKAGIVINENVKKIMDPAVEKFAVLEERVRGTYEKFFKRKQEITMSAEDQQKHIIEEAMQKKSELDSLIEKARSLGMNIQFT